MANGVPPANTWTSVAGCSGGPDSPSIAYSILITGVPATIGSVNNGLYAWSITLNDGGTPPNFSIDRYDPSGNLLDHPVVISGVDGSVLLAQDPIAPLGAATKQYVDAHTSGAVPEAPIDGASYVRNNGSWFPMGGPYLPLVGGTITGALNLSSAAVLTVNGSNSLVLNGPPGAQRSVLGMTANQARWVLMLGDGTLETGGNTGSNLTLMAYGGTGTYISTPLAINRASGVVTFGVMPSIPGGASGQVLSTNGAGGLSWVTGGGGGGGGVPEAPTDGQLYGRENATWVVVPSGGGGGIADAPSDGSAYARKNAAWSHLTHVDILDWDATLGAYATNADLANYALISSVPVASATPPLMNGTVNTGSSAAFSRGDHVHPVDTSRYAASNPSGYQTAGQVTTTVNAALVPYALSSSLPAASNALPIIDGTAAAGTATTYARADHVHPAAVVPAGGDTRDAEFFGDGSDGAAAITTAVTLTRDMYYSNLTVSGAGSLNTAGYRVFVSGVLDISAAAAGALIGAAITAALPPSTSVGGVGGIATVAARSYSQSVSASNGGNGTSGNNGGNGQALQSIAGAYWLGGIGGIGGGGGLPSSGQNTAGAGGVISLPNFPQWRIRVLTTVLYPPFNGASSLVAFTCGTGGSGGGAGGSASGLSGAGGGGGSAGPNLYLYARTINRGPSTGIGALSAAAGPGAAGGNGAVGANSGGGGGGGGGAGGLLYLVYRFLTGASAPSALNASGGPGAAGGNPGTANGAAGIGGAGGGAGFVVVFNLAADTVTSMGGAAGVTPSAQPGGAGGSALVTL